MYCKNWRQQSTYRLIPYKLGNNLNSDTFSCSPLMQMSERNSAWNDFVVSNAKCMIGILLVYVHFFQIDQSFKFNPNLYFPEFPVPTTA